MTEHPKMMLPLWLACPKIARYSIGWRMGYGEDYAFKWHNWYQSLPAKEQAAYQKLFPEPPTWKGFWNNTDDCVLYRRGDFRVHFWDRDGSGAPKYSLDQIRQDYTAGKRLTYCMFWKTQPASDTTLTRGCLSQWYTSPFYADTVSYCSMEQYMMSHKAELFGDKEMKQQILSSSDPKKIKALGQKVRNFDEAIWGNVKYSIILNGNYLKFLQSPRLKHFLLQTGDKILVEASPYDGVWGIKMAESDEAVQNPLNWRGQNLLGFALMEVRDALREICRNEHLAQPAECE
ncbi:MAG: NADAR family protein [Lachnospiraceae bacterium]|nr:NADAR family protein [Lachnospiraceae bacterium]